MKFSLKSIAAAVVLAAAATGANAAVNVLDNGASGNGELFFNIWDINGSYSLDLNIKINDFNTLVAAPGSINQTFIADSTFASFMAGTAGGVRSGDLKWNVVALDNSGARRLLTTYTAPEVSSVANDIVRSAAIPVQAYATAVNTAMAGSNSVAVNSASAAYAGKSTFGDKIGTWMNFSNAGTLANNTFANGLGFMRIDALATGIANSQYNEYLDPAAVNVWLDSSKTLHIAAMPVPEPESYAMLLAGLGMIGFMARRRNNRA